jgi:hypothetical protein
MHLLGYFDFPLFVFLSFFGCMLECAGARTRPVQRC